VHARKAWLKGLSPRENRTVPALDYERVFELKRCFPTLEVILNGGVNELDAAEPMLEHCDGVMLGRAAFSRPLAFSEADRRFYARHTPPPALADVLRAYLDYLAPQSTHGKVPHTALAPLAGLFSGLRGARRTRRGLGALAATRELSVLAEVLAPWMQAEAA